jgi:hypothetical protein
LFHFCLLPSACSELEVRKAGAPGRFILDDPKKYPAKDDIGIFREWQISLLLLLLLGCIRAVL